MPAEKAMELGRQYAQEVLSGKGTELWTKFSAELQAGLKDQASWNAFTASVPNQIGHETQLIAERVMPIMKLQAYERIFRSSAVPMPLEFSVTFAPDGTIDGLYVHPPKNPAESKYLDYKTKTPLQLPFKGEWTIYWGGHSTYDNYHAYTTDQRFAYDIDIERNGRQFDGDGTRFEQFYAYGQPILAPAAGTVVSVEDKYDDNLLMHPSKDNPPQGNNIVIDHGDGEFSMFAHLKRGSIVVKPGDKVQGGQPIAQCGNSGNSPFPHLHYHLQTTPKWFNGEGLPAAFHNFLLNGKPVSVAEPIRGDKVKANQ
jgi:murein DD-endopeptidase MepM/ murein hydrolase activator NlpD